MVAAAALHYAVELRRALAEIARVLRPGGVFILADSPVYVDAFDRHRAWQRTLRYYTEQGAPHLAERYRGLTRQELDACGFFRFVTMSPGVAPWRLLRASAGARRMPVLFGWKTE